MTMKHEQSLMRQDGRAIIHPCQACNHLRMMMQRPLVSRQRLPPLTNRRSDLIEFISIKSSASKGEDKPGMMAGTAEVPHPIVDAHLPEAAAVFDAAPALGPAMDRVAPQPTLVELLVRPVLVPRELLP
jgi:hypothetical protein